MRLLFVSWLLFLLAALVARVIAVLIFARARLVMPAALELAVLPLVQSAALVRAAGALGFRHHLRAWRQALSRWSVRALWMVAGLVLLGTALWPGGSGSGTDAGRLAAVVSGLYLLAAGGILVRLFTRRHHQLILALAGALIAVGAVCLSPANRMLWSTPPPAATTATELGWWCALTLGLLAVALGAGRRLPAPAGTLLESTVIPGIVSVAALVPCLHTWPLIHGYWLDLARTSLVLAAASFLTSALCARTPAEATPAKAGVAQPATWRRWLALWAVLTAAYLSGRWVLDAVIPLRWSWSLEAWCAAFMTTGIQTVALYLWQLGGIASNRHGS